MAERKVAVVGASGFVGSAVAAALRGRGVAVVPVGAPRLTVSPADLDEAATAGLPAAVEERLRGCSVVVNAAGLSDAGADDEEALLGANALLPGLLARACHDLGVRFVHISSAAVQGRRPVLDSSREVAPVTPYARAKAQGERLVLAADPAAVVYRPAGVHGEDRAVTRRLTSLARGPFRTVAGSGDANSPQALLADVADAVAELALIEAPLPSVVHHPSAGVTTRHLLELLGGGARPRRVPMPVARTVLAGASLAGRAHGRIGALARRLDVLWLGQDQAPSWLENHGWRPVTQIEDWERLGETVARRAEPDDQGER
ncbi:NAD-dependent epimerase/dehydratase family protein [Phycicoccus avicenniae]|uniref:NAD-dependent epimerase/dehydratase family protein n=1 Tax=Phycicoccus avicenniae TaxID=2828860 RepID=UPI003D292F17